MSFGSYLAGSIELIALAAAVGFGAVRLRARMLPGWSGAPARLAEFVLGLSLLVVVLELVGVVGLYRPGWVLVAGVLAGLGVGLWAGPRDGQGVSLPAPKVAPIALGVATAAGLLVAAHWAMPTQTGLDIGMYLPNTTWHNAPFAARFVQDAQVGALHMTEVLKLTVWFYPQNSELLHSVGILFLGNDFLSPLLNIGWMALCLLAAWCFGRPYAAGAIAVLAVAVIVDAEMLLLYQGGDAKNDIAGLFFLLASAALLVNGDAQARAAAASARTLHSDGPPLRPQLPRGALIVAALAAGLALGTKLNLLAPFGLLTLGVIFVARSGDRIRTAAIWVAGALLTGGFWFARNLVEAGNPLPWFDRGPLPGPEQLDIDIREPFTVSDYLTDRGVIRDYFIPGLNDSFGLLWPLVLAAVAGGIVLAIWRGRTTLLRTLGVVALLSGIAYLFTPLTAAGPEGAPSAFEVNLRYASPALTLGALLLSVDPWVSRERVQPFAMIALGLLLVVGLFSGADDVWSGDYLLGGVLLAVFLIGVPVALALASGAGVPRPAIAAATALALGLAVGIGWARSEDYLDGRYRAETAPADFPQGVRAALAWFNREQPTDARIAVVGGRPGFKQYVFYGDDLSNRVQYVARHGPHGAYVPIATDPEDLGDVAACERWKTALNEGDYDYVVIGPDQRSQEYSPVEAVWTGSDPAATKLVDDDLIFVFAIEGALDASSCADFAGRSPGRPPGTKRRADRVSFGDYLTGVLGLVLVAVSVGFAAVRLRGRLLPGWEAAPARLAEAVLGLSLLTVLLQLLGAVGLFAPAAIVLASVAVGAGVSYAVRPADPAGAAAVPGPHVRWPQTLIALAVAAFVAAHWATGLQDVWARGMLTFDTLWYHGPFAARIAEQGSVWALHLTDPLYLNWFYPQNSELLHATGISLLDRDLLSPLVNFGWLGIALLAAWCIGRPYGVAALSAVAVALVLDVGPLVPREAGTPANDIAPVALLLAAAAVLVNAAAQARASASAARTLHSAGPPLREVLPLGAVLVAGLAMGLALGTKLTIAGAVAAMAVGLPLVLPAGVRRRALLVFLGGVAVTAAFWFLRNLIHSGNPLPWLRELGPIDLPGPDRGLEGRDDFTVSHYIVNFDSAVWSQYFYRPITNLLGPAWPLFLGLGAAGTALAIARPRTPTVRMLGAVAAVSAVAYLFTPLTAAGPEGQPLAFGINLRYLIPALALGLALLTLEPKLTPERWRLPLLGGGALTLLLTSFYSDSAYIWREPFASPPAAVLIGVALIGVPAGIAVLARARGRGPATAVATLAALALVALGWARQDAYLDSRYTRAEDFRFQFDRLAAWAKPTEDLEIGVAGTSGGYNQYLLYGDRLSNRVQYVGDQLPAGDFRRLEKCAEFVGAVNDGGYDYLVTTPELDLNDPGREKPSPERAWVLAAAGPGAAEEVLRTGRVSVFRIDGELDPERCGTSA